VAVVIYIDAWYASAGTKGNDAMRKRLMKMVARAIIRKTRKKKTYVLLVRKVSEPDTWELPGGRRKWKESWFQSLFRELKEELGVTIAELQCEFWQEVVMATTHDSNTTVRIRVYAVELAPRKRPKAQNEIIEYRWVALDKLATLPLERKTKILLDMFFNL
jgi:8-oxo-dGTP pyrophosphatase MutT (NUDIX family)